jgi:hypothetical protein
MFVIKNAQREQARVAPLRTSDFGLLSAFGLRISNAMLRWIFKILPESVLNEDEQLQMIYDTAVTRTDGAD